jgi:glycosyltransferase involved in cell wall biosynthesis
MKFSILLPCLNGEKYLEQAITGVLGQDYKNWELLIIDGKSTDNSHKIIDKYSKSDARVKWLKYKDTGLSNALNYALDYAEGDIVGYLGFDDYYSKGIFTKINNFLEKHKDFSWIYGNSFNVYPEDGSSIFVKPGRFSYNTLFLGDSVGLQNVFFDKEILKFYKFDENNKYSMDFELYFRIFRGYKPLYIEEIISYNIQQRNNISSKTSKKGTPGRIEVENIVKGNAKTTLQKLLVLVRISPALRNISLRVYKLINANIISKLK